MKTAFILLLIIFAFSFSDSPLKAVTKEIIGDTTIITDYGYKKVFTNYRDGKKNGNEISILSNGDTMEIAQYKDGKYDGRVVAFYERNKIAAISFYKDDNKVGEWLYFDTLGNLRSCLKIEFRIPIIFFLPRMAQINTNYSWLNEKK